jgi:hypothetical protein
LEKRGVSGEFKYFGSASMTVRPPKATTRPVRLKMGKMTRPRKRSRYSPVLEPGRTRPPFSRSETGTFFPWKKSRRAVQEFRA